MVEIPLPLFCRSKKGWLQASFDSFPAASFIRWVLARFFLFVYNQARIEKHLFLQRKHQQRTYREGYIDFYN